MSKHLYGTVLLLLVLLVSCKNEIIETDAIKYPDISLKGARYLLGREDGDNVLFNAEQMDIYLNEKDAKLKGVSFEQKKDSNGELFVSGTSDNADINTETFLSTLNGNVRITLHEGNNSINTDSINWNKDTQNVTSDGRVELKYGDITIDGINFSGNLQTGTFTFSKIRRGFIKDNKQTEQINQTEQQEEKSDET